ncbi:peptide chain release factor N(5)-glutamine methyltransferase [Pseudomaricurvus sp.]|uniref:peptide chain release factor N(5)-glutamine methyltransferase n=1 Tax=Pseudomaricurvus sp. TaxID=2004510 RepID=UPI003F6BB4F4
MSDVSQPITIQVCVQRAQELEHSESARLDVELLLASVLERDRAYLYTWPEKVLTEAQVSAFEALLTARKDGRPVAHLLGEREFWGLPLAVDDSTLIPRPDTETLVEAVLALDLPDKAQVLDLGTGTGAIALALASEQPQWSVTAVDFSAAAVALAERNRQNLALTNVGIMVSNWFSQLQCRQFHLIVSNPPYIDENDPHLARGDVRFEPLSALVAENKGLADLQHIVETAREHLLPGGRLLLEHGYTQGEAVRGLLLEAGYQDIETLTDFGSNDRVTCGRYPGKPFS